MPGTFVPAQMFDFELNPKKGWPSPYAVDYSAPYAGGVTGVRAGMVISLNPDGEFVRGLFSGTACPVFVFQNQSDFDVLSDLGNVSGGVASGLVALGAYELQTTEFVDGPAYESGTLLTVENDPADPDFGKVRPITAGANVLNDETVVGVVSSGTSVSEHHTDIGFLSFWPMFIPAVGR